MARGRRSIPDEIKALKGNPGKRKLALDKIGKRERGAARPQQFIADAPDYLTQDGERQAFRMALESLPGNVARRSDTHAIARWATWLNIWVSAKLKLDGKAHWYESESKHGKFLREHPISKRMHQAETHLVSLEDRLGLNIVARNNIVHRLFQMPGPPPGGLFGDDRQDEKNDQPIPIDGVAEPEVLSPLGFLQQAGKPH